MNNKLQEAFIDDPEMLRTLEQRQQTKLLKDIANKKPSMEETFSQILGLLKGDKGIDGISPTEEELKDLIKPLIPEPLKGKDGENGRDGKNGRDGRDGRSIVGPEGPKGESIVGLTGKDGKSVSVEELITRLQSLKGKEAEFFGKTIGSMIDISQIRNAQSFMFNGKRIKFEELLHGGGPSSSVSSGYQVPTGTVNGINAVFTFTTAPSAIVVDGVSMRKVATDGTVNWTGTTVITLAVAPNFDIYGVA